MVIFFENLNRFASGLFSNKESRQKDIVMGILTFILAFLIRAPQIEKPIVAVLDEAVFKVYALNTLAGKPFFEPSPPLGWMIFSLSTFGMSPEKIGSFPSAVGSLFFGFPFEKARAISLFFGSLIPVFLFIFARLLKFSIFESILPAVFAVFDNALIIHSRIMMPDAIMIFLGLAGVVTVFFALREEEWSRYRIPLLFAGILFGMTFSIKWTGLAYLAIGSFLFLLAKKYKAVFFVSVTAFLTYLFIMVFYFNIFAPGPVIKEAGFYENGPGTEIVFPGTGEWLENLKFVGTYSRAMFSMRSSSVPSWLKERGDSPYWWLVPGARKADMFYLQNSSDSRKIILRGNPVSWSLVSLSLLVLIIVALKKIIKSKEFANAEVLLIFAFAINFVPFLFIDYFSSSPVWLYHYLSALCFGFLAVPLALRIIIKKENLRRWVYYAIIFGSVLPYGFTLSSIYCL